MRRRRLIALTLISSVLLALATAEGVLAWLDWFDPPVFGRHPSYGYFMKPNQSVSTQGRRFQINSLGWRGPEIQPVRDPATTRVAFLGDSITFGGGAVSDEDLFPHRVRSLLSERGPEVEVVSIAAPGWGIENIARYVEAKGVFSSDLVIWVIPAIDFRRPLSQLEYHFFQTTKPRFRLHYLFMLGHYQLRLRFGGGGVAADTYSVEALRENLVTVRAMFAAWRRSSVLAAMVLVPGRDGYGDGKDAEQFRRVASDCDVPLLDTATTLLPMPAPGGFMDDMHLNPQGHTAAAGAIAPFAREILARRATGEPRALVPPDGCVSAAMGGVK